ncbi:MAG: bacillithiol biosynthesis deacetylase BshB1, partial [Chitinophagales bacterium]
MKVDILAFAAHPDDVELSCSGTIAKHIAMGKKAAVVDFTQGELGSRGTAELRLKEAAASAKILGLSARENLGFRDGFFKNDEQHQLEVIKMLRKYRPDIVLANAPYDRHPDHGRAAKLVEESCFYSGLKMIATEIDGQKQEAWRPRLVLNYIQSVYHKPDLVVNISSQMQTKLSAIAAFSSQFNTGKSSDEKEQTFISTPQFMDFIKARASEYGQLIEVQYAEGFLSKRY